MSFFLSPFIYFITFYLSETLFGWDDIIKHYFSPGLVWSVWRSSERWSTRKTSSTTRTAWRSQAVRSRTAFFKWNNVFFFILYQPIIIVIGVHTPYSSIYYGFIVLVVLLYVLWYSLYSLFNFSGLFNVYIYLYFVTKSSHVYYNQLCTIIKPIIPVLSSCYGVRYTVIECHMGNG